ncbi:hypothetical protein CK203_102488 [Vitis vinifera]|uniref:Uncharacterized protein n=1 Tax=Vitis vinifera TaxID=29760 RepID=A0A438C6N9_VITVI|nr:hypothetical protein CK203_102488 [Vitis vinifera]
MEWKELHGIGIRYEKQVPGTLTVECHLLLGWIGGTMWAATSCLGAWRPLYKGAAARFAPFHLQQLGLERESRERKCRFEALSFDILFMWDRGPWVKVPKALEEDTPMWVYGVGPAPGF